MVSTIRFLGKASSKKTKSGKRARSIAVKDILELRLAAKKAPTKALAQELRERARRIALIVNAKK